MPIGADDALDRGFQPAIDFFSQKVNLPTRTWRDVWQGEHSRAFVVAGAMKADLLADLRGAVDRAINDGEGYEAFRKRFKDIVARHGWEHTGSAAWRSRVIWHTNMRTSFAAGRYKQMTDPDVLAHMPWWLYDHTTVVNPREQHQAMDGKVWRYDDPVWRWIYPPNGWGCNCRVRPLSDRQLRKLGKEGPDPAPTQDEFPVPPEWRYNVGETAWGRPQVDAAVRKLQDDTWRAVPGRPYQAFNRPDALPIDTPRSAPLQGVGTAPDAVRDAWRAQYGEQATITDAAGDVVLLSERIVDHWLDQPGTRLAGREAYIPLVREVLEDPAEIWVNWAVNGTGRYALRRYYLKRLALRDGRTLTLIVDADGTVWTGFNFMVGRNTQPQNRQGLLVWSRP
jgi:hypothetical protein